MLRKRRTAEKASATAQTLLFQEIIFCPSKIPKGIKLKTANIPLTYAPQPNIAEILGLDIVIDNISKI